MDYKSSGVDIEAGYKSVELMKAAVKGTMRPEVLGGLGGFSKKKLKNPDDPEYIEKFIIECNKGMVTHRLAYPIGFLAMLTFPNICALTIALPIAIVNLFLNILPTLALRYNTPMLASLLKRLKRKDMINFS